MHALSPLAEHRPCLCCRCSMRLGAMAATVVNVLLLTFFILSSLQTPISSRRLFRLGRSLRSEDHPEVALPRQLTVQPAESSFRLGVASDTSYFMPWIRQDFQRYSSSGISWVRPPTPLACAAGLEQLAASLQANLPLILCTAACCACHAAAPEALNRWLCRTWWRRCRGDTESASERCSGFRS